MDVALAIDTFTGDGGTRIVCQIDNLGDFSFSFYRAGRRGLFDDHFSLCQVSPLTISLDFIVSE